MSLIAWLRKAQQPDGSVTNYPTGIDHESNVSGEEDAQEHAQTSNVAGPASTSSESGHHSHQPDATDASETRPVAGAQPQPTLMPWSPHQPLLSFPYRTFAKQQRAFCSSWYRRYPWLHYQEADDKVFCFYCQVAEKKDLGSVALRAGNLDDKFVRTGFTDWKKALTKFEKHQKSVFHRDAMDMVVGKEQNVGQMLGKGYAEEMVENRNMLQIIISCIRYLARQGLAMRGRSKPEGSVALERDSNLMQLLIMRAEDNPRLWKWLDKCQAKFTSPCIQNEILSIMALMILRDVVRKVSGKWYTIMVDETTDLSNTEQMVFCLRYVDDDLEVHEEVIGLYSLDSTSADSILATVQDILLRMNLRIDHCRGQCYDGASNMAGAKSGVAKRLNDLEPRALYTHCYGHALNLATQDVLKGIKVMRSALETVHEITKLIKKSPKRESIFKKFKNVVTAGSPGLRILCPTRWTVRAEALTSISENYTTLQMTWDVAKEATKDTEMRARIGGIALQMDTFDFVYGVELGRKLLNIVDNLSRSLQSSTISACEGQKLVSTTTTTIQSMRSDECFDIFWKYVERKRLSLQVPSPTLPRRRKVPRQFEVGEGATVHPVEVKEIYRRAYFEAIDLILAAVKDRFHQKGFNMLQKLETVVTSLQQPQQSEALKEIVNFYGDDFSHPDRLQTQLTLLHAGTEQPLTDVRSLVVYLKSLSSAERQFFSEVIKVVKLILVMPATNATSERSFSALRRLKTWLRSTISECRLNWSMILHIHKDKTDALPIKGVANEFVTRNESRRRLFGHFD